MKTYTTLIGSALVALSLTACTKTDTTDITPSVAPSGQVTTAVEIAEGIPGGMISNTLAFDAEVIEIDHKARTATLLMPGGKQLPVAPGEEAINFDLIKKGDRVKAMVTEQLVVYVDGNNAVDNGIVAAEALAEKGVQPGGIIGSMTRATARVTAIDQDAHTATLTFDDGTVQTTAVRPDVELSEESIGKKVVFEITEMVEISVEAK